MSKSAEAVAKAVVLLQAFNFIATCRSTLVHCLLVPLPAAVLVAVLNLAVQDWGPTCVSHSSSCFHLGLQKNLELFLGCVGKRNNTSSAVESPAERERHMSEASSEAVVPSKAYWKARDANTSYTCILPLHPAASTHSESLDALVGQVPAAGLRPWKAAVRIWRTGRRSLRSRWTPTKPKAALPGGREMKLCWCVSFFKFSCYSKA